MVAFYVNRIKSGRMGFSEVPRLWRDAVFAAMVAYYVSEIGSGNMTIDDVPDFWREDVEKALNTNG